MHFSRLIDNMVDVPKQAESRRNSLVLGEAAALALYCLIASERRVPPVTEIVEMLPVFGFDETEVVRVLRALRAEKLISEASDGSASVVDLNIFYREDPTPQDQRLQQVATLHKQFLENPLVSADIQRLSFLKA